MWSTCLRWQWLASRRLFGEGVLTKPNSCNRENENVSVYVVLPKKVYDRPQKYFKWREEHMAPKRRPYNTTSWWKPSYGSGHHSVSKKNKLILACKKILVNLASWIQDSWLCKSLFMQTPTSLGDVFPLYAFSATLQCYTWCCVLPVHRWVLKS